MTDISNCKGMKFSQITTLSKDAFFMFKICPKVVVVGWRKKLCLTLDQHFKHTQSCSCPNCSVHQLYSSLYSFVLSIKQLWSVPLKLCSVCFLGLQKFEVSDFFISKLCRVCFLALQTFIVPPFFNIKFVVSTSWH